MATAPAPAKGKSKKFPSMQSPVTWAVVLGIAVAAGAYLLYRRNKAATPAATTPSTTDTTATDYSGQIATLQAEIANLQSSFGQDESGDATVPKVTGLSVAAADAMIRAAGLVPGAHSDATGTVNGQTPAAGTKVASGSKVDLSVGAAGSDTDVGEGKAPGAPSVTPRAGGADVSWGTVEDAKAYQLLVQGATGHGTGTSHVDRVVAGNHARVTLGPGKYVARVRAGSSAVNVHGPWSKDTAFTVPRHTVTRPRKPAPGEGEE